LRDFEKGDGERCLADREGYDTEESADVQELDGNDPVVGLNVVGMQANSISSGCHR
jgi:hypothetical protein